MLTLAYQLFAALCGWLEAILYGERGAESFSSNEHVGMTLQRASVVLCVAAGLFDYHFLGYWVALELAPTALLFPMCHDEAYNFTRLWLTQSAKYQAMATIPGSLSPDRAAWRAAWIEYRYGYQSPTTTARNDFNGTARTWLAIAGGALLLALYVLTTFHILFF
jgi:hypothetical protein